MLCGCVLAYFYETTHTVTRVIAGKIPGVAKEILAGICLGVIGMLIPAVMFSGEEQMGAILCGHDGRRGCLYHVCVDVNHRMRGIGKAMVVFTMEALKKEGINKVSLIAFTQNDIGNAFWNEIGWTKREDLNYYDFTLNEANITAFIQ